MKKNFFLGLAILGLVITTLGMQQQSKESDIVVFSYDRPMQVLAFLESAEKYVTHVNKIFVVYRASHDGFEEGYQEVKKYYPKVTFFRQSNQNPKKDFKPLSMQAAFSKNLSKARYLLFSTDDIIVKDKIDLSEAISHLQRTGAYGFYFSLGKHVDYCYTMDKYQGIPPLKPEGEGVFSWQFSEGKYDWDYPHSVDMRLYAKKTIESGLRRLKFTNPNELEGQWARHADHSKRGITYATSKTVNIPMNLVNEKYANRHMDAHSPEELLELFMRKRKKIDISVFHQIKNSAAHMEYAPTFVAID